MHNKSAMKCHIGLANTLSFVAAQVYRSWQASSTVPTTLGCPFLPFLLQGELLVEAYTACLRLLLNVIDVEASCSDDMAFSSDGAGQPSVAALATLGHLQQLLSMLSSLPLRMETGPAAVSKNNPQPSVGVEGSRAIPDALSGGTGSGSGITAVLQLLSISSVTDAAAWQLEALQQHLSAQQVHSDCLNREPAAREASHRLQAGRTAVAQAGSKRTGLLARLVSLRAQGRLSEAAQLEAQAQPVCEKECEAMSAAEVWLTQGVLHEERRAAAAEHQASTPCLTANIIRLCI
jgi:hypothetical protein